MSVPPGLSVTISQIMRDDRGRLLSALIASLNNFDLAEEALSDAVEAALSNWQRTGVPDNPRGWLLRVARRKAIDGLRRNARFRDRVPELERLAQEDEMDANSAAADIPDKRLALIFTCCHPALDAKTRVALTLRTLGGLSTAEIAQAYLDKEATMGQRLSRAKSKIAVAKIPFVVPGPDAWPERLSSVLAVIYLIFNEGYSASSGKNLFRTDLCDEAIYLARLMDQLRPQEAEIMGLLSLMLTTHARRNARQTDTGVAIELAEQDRRKWDRHAIAEGTAILDEAVSLSAPGPYQIKAAISALHVQATDNAATDWPQIVMLYDSLLHHEPTAVVRLNREVALAESGEIAQALERIGALEPELSDYQPFHAARARYLAAEGCSPEAIQSYENAIALTGNAADRAYLEGRKRKLMH